MESKKAFKISWKHIICCFVLLIVFVLTIGMHINAEGPKDDIVADSSSDTVPLKAGINNYIASLNFAEQNEVELAGPKEEVTVEIVYDVNYYITTYAETIKFFAQTFGVKYENVLADLQARDELYHDEFEKTNIGYLRDAEGNIKKYNSVEYGIVEYFYDYVESHPKEVSKKWVPYSGNAKYVENLIIYYTTHIYTNVDTATALSIGAAESGYYKVKYMLKYNNIYGGMSSKGLIKYKNIEYGVLSYVRLLSKNYYGKGLDTIAKIGKIYCPKYDNNGLKIASPHWISLVNKAMDKYQKYNLDIIFVDMLASRNA